MPAHVLRACSTCSGSQLAQKQISAGDKTNAKCIVKLSQAAAELAFPSVIQMIICAADCIAREPHPFSACPWHCSASCQANPCHPSLPNCRCFFTRRGRGLQRRLGPGPYAGQVAAQECRLEEAIGQAQNHHLVSNKQKCMLSYRS